MFLKLFCLNAVRLILNQLLLGLWSWTVLAACEQFFYELCHTFAPLNRVWGHAWWVQCRLYSLLKPLIHLWDYLWQLFYFANLMNVKLGSSFGCRMAMMLAFILEYDFLAVNRFPCRRAIAGSPAPVLRMELCLHKTRGYFAIYGACKKAQWCWCSRLKRALCYP